MTSMFVRALACPSPRCTDEAPGRGCRCAAPPTSHVTRAGRAAATLPSWRRARGPTGPRSRTSPPPPPPHPLPEREKRGEDKSRTWKQRWTWTCQSAAPEALFLQRLDQSDKSSRKKKAWIVSINSDREEMGGVWRREGGRDGGGWDISMAAVAVATPLHQHTEGWGAWAIVWRSGGSRVPSSLVWVSVPPSASASSSAPGSLNGLSLRERRGGERRQHAVHSAWEQREGGRMHRWRQGCWSESEDVSATVQLQR